ncbi:MAG: glycosyltransferase family 39 protein, partial [Bdellovibrionales bacterium]|nr:glycosyltransferase family 39 protein [Bdellovibrionales bacterium]
MAHTSSNNSNLLLHRLIPSLAALILLLCLPSALQRPFQSKGEPREALVAQAMLKSGEWILPSRYDGEFATKPPMTHWLMALSSLPSGKVSEFTSRLPSILLSVLAVCCFFYIIASRGESLEATISTFILLTSALWFRQSTAARVDMPLSGFMITALLLFYRWELMSLRGTLIPGAISVLLACAALTKGPVALALPGAVGVSYLYLRRYKFRSIVGNLSKIFLPAFILTLLWYLAAYRTGGLEFWNIVYSENIARFTGTM